MNIALKIKTKNIVNILLVSLLLSTNLTSISYSFNLTETNAHSLAPKTVLPYQLLTNEKEKLSPIISSIITFTLIGSSLFAYFSYYTFIPEFFRPLLMLLSVLLFQLFSHEFGHFLTMRGLNVNDAEMRFKFNFIPIGVNSKQEFEKLTIPKAIFALTAGPIMSLINAIAVTAILLSNNFFESNKIYTPMNIKILPIVIFFITSSFLDFLSNLFGSYWLAKKGKVLGDGAMIYALREILNHLKYKNKNLNIQINELPETISKVIKESANGRIDITPLTGKKNVSFTEILKLLVIDYKKQASEKLLISEEMSVSA